MLCVPTVIPVTEYLRSYVFAIDIFANFNDKTFPHECAKVVNKGRMNTELFDNIVCPF